VRFGVSLPNVGDCGSPQTLVQLGREAEAAGWDGVFVWDCVHIEIAERDRLPMADPWIALAAIASATSRVRIGPIVEEGLEILTGLWSGEPFSYHGDHYQLEEMTFLPRPVQSPRIPIWLDAVWPRMRSMRRAARYDGVIAGRKDEDGGPITPEDIRVMRRWIEEHRRVMEPIDIVHEGETPGDDPNAAIAAAQPWADAGVTWWIESVWSHFYRGTLETMRERIRQGPPRGAKA